LQESQENGLFLDRPMNHIVQDLVCEHFVARTYLILQQFKVLSSSDPQKFPCESLFSKLAQTPSWTLSLHGMILTHTLPGYFQPCHGRASISLTFIFVVGVSDSEYNLSNRNFKSKILKSIDWIPLTSFTTCSPFIQKQSLFWEHSSELVFRGFRHSKALLSVKDGRCFSSFILRTGILGQHVVEHV